MVYVNVVNMVDDVELVRFLVLGVVVDICGDFFGKSVFLILGML